jgi:uncharacterized phage-associated protein
MLTILNHLRDFGYNVNGRLMGSSADKPYNANLSVGEKGVIDHVWRKYSGFTGFELSEMTHEPGTPWSNAYFGRGRNAILSQSDIQNHFIGLAIAGRERTA